MKWMFGIKRVMVLAVAITSLVVGAGCGKKGPAADTPEGLGEAAATLYVDTITATVAALESKPAPAEAKAKLGKIIDDAETKLVELGRKRAKLAPADQAKFDNKLQQGMSRVGAATFEKLSEIAKHYSKADRETGNLVASVNVITQFANFDLLKKQDPDKAKKHGVE